MAWQTNVLMVTGDVVTAAQYNINYYNLRYLKGLDGDITLSDHIVGNAKAAFVDGVGTHTHLSAGAEGGVLAVLATAAQAEPVRAINTIYRNTTGKLLLVNINLDLPANAGVRCYVNTDTPPSGPERVFAWSSTHQIYTTATFLVPVNHYYNCNVSVGSPVIMDWTEWTLH